VEQLTKSGFVQRERSAIPVYTITEKGRLALKDREVPAELADEISAVR
jgi:predicted transcriptional regulator